jgi:hypothetical protein
VPVTGLPAHRAVCNYKMRPDDAPTGNMLIYPPASKPVGDTDAPNMPPKPCDHQRHAGLGKPPGEAAGHDGAPRSSSASPAPRKSAAAADAPAGDSKMSQLIRPAHSEGGPTAGLVAKTQELLQRFRDTPGDTFNDRCMVVLFRIGAL